MLTTRKAIHETKEHIMKTTKVRIEIIMNQQSVSRKLNDSR